MQDIDSEFIIADKLLEEFSRKSPKFVQRFVSIKKDIEIFIDKTQLSQHVYVDPLLLGYALFNYFEDIMRLKEFHHVGHVNNIKIVSYTAYWLLRMKPIQSKEPHTNAVYINERFVLSYILSYLELSDLGRILERDNSALKAFAESLFYYLKYRTVNAQVIEMMIVSFFAGQAYQETDTDISALLGKFPKESNEKENPK